MYFLPSHITTGEDGTDSNISLFSDQFSEFFLLKIAKQ